RSLHSPEMFQFEGYTLDVGRSSLRTADRDVQLRPKAFEVLRYLVENADRLVTKEELIQAIWPDVTVTDEALAHCVSEARQAIGDGDQAIIKTVPRKGYRLAAPVLRVTAPGTAGVPPALFQRAGETPAAPRGVPPASESGPRSQSLPPDRPCVAV